jgi:hypothetical protein
MGRACDANGREEDRLLVGKQDGKKPLGRPRCSWIDTIMMDLLEIM